MIRLRGFALLAGVVALLGCVRVPLPVADTSTHSARPPVVAVTPEAAEMVHQFIREAADGEDYHLRLRVVAGGCQGFMHKLDLEPTVTGQDVTFLSGGVRVVVLRRQVEMLRGTRVDYVTENGKTGFKVTNPHFTGEESAKWLAALQNEKDAD